MTTQFDTHGLESYIPNRELESVEGVWLRFPGGRAFRCLRAGGSNTKFVRAFQAAIKPYARQIERKTLDPELSDQIMRDVYSRTVVKDWEGIEDADGNDVPYSPETAVEFFKVVPELFNELTDQCANMANFAEAVAEEAKEVLGEA